MVATREQVHLHEPIAFAPSYKAVFQHCLLGVLHLVVVGIRLVLLLVAHEPVFKRALVLGRPVGYHRPVCLVHLALAKHVAQSAQSLRRAGEDHQSAHRTVEAVNHTKEYIPRLRILHPDVFLHGVGERGVAGLVALYNLPALLVHHDDMIILIDYSHQNS